MHKLYKKTMFALKISSIRCPSNTIKRLENNRVCDFILHFFMKTIHWFGIGIYFQLMINISVFCDKPTFNGIRKEYLIVDEMLSSYNLLALNTRFLCFLPLFMHVFVSNNILLLCIEFVE